MGQTTWTRREKNPYPDFNDGLNNAAGIDKSATIRKKEKLDSIPPPFTQETM